MNVMCLEVAMIQLRWGARICVRMQCVCVYLCVCWGKGVWQVLLMSTQYPSPYLLTET